MAEESKAKASPDTDKPKLSPKDARRALQNAEERYQNFVDKRTEFNAQAAALRDERNSLNDQKKGMFNTLDLLKKDRYAVIEKLKEHRDRRNALQNRARQLISHKQQRTKQMGRKGGTSTRELRSKVKDLDQHQQTSNLTLEEERALLERLKRLYGELQAQEKEEEAQGEIDKEISELNASIDELFKKADEEHAQVVANSKAADELRAREKEQYFSIAHLGSEADKKHKEFLEARKRADHNHERAMELRGTMNSIRKEQRSERDELRRNLTDHNRRSRRSVADKRALDAAAEDSLTELLKSGKITLK